MLVHLMLSCYKFFVRFHYKTYPFYVKKNLLKRMTGSHSFFILFLSCSNIFILRPFVSLLTSICYGLAYTSYFNYNINDLFLCTLISLSCKQYLTSKEYERFTRARCLDTRKSNSRQHRILVVHASIAVRGIQKHKTVTY